MMERIFTGHHDAFGMPINSGDIILYFTSSGSGVTKEKHIVIGSTKACLRTIRQPVYTNGLVVKYDTARIKGDRWTMAPIETPEDIKDASTLIRAPYNCIIWPNSGDAYTLDVHQNIKDVLDEI